MSLDQPVMAISHVLAKSRWSWLDDELYFWFGDADFVHIFNSNEIQRQLRANKYNLEVEHVSFIQTGALP